MAQGDKIRFLLILIQELKQFQSQIFFITRKIIFKINYDITNSTPCDLFNYSFLKDEDF
jgi:hypothetical protein